MIDLQTILTYLTLISVPVGVAYHIITIRNQSRTRQAQLFMQMYDRFNENTEDYDIVTTLQNAKVKSVEDFLHLWENDDTFFKAIRAMTRFCEALGVLVKENLLDIRYVALMWAGPTRMFWEMFEPILPSLAEHWNYPRLWSETAYLCRELIKYMEQHPELAT
jgi:hypothetical protein